MPGLSVSDVVNVDINLAPVAVPLRNFGTLLIAGPSKVIDTSERVRAYATLDAIAADFGTTAPEYLAANLYFSQQPRPAICYVGRFAQTGTSAILHGGILTTAQQTTLLAQLKLVTNGTFAITIDGTPKTVAASPATLFGGLFDSAAQTALIATLVPITTGSFQLTIDGTVCPITALNFAAPVIPVGNTDTQKLTEIALRINAKLAVAAKPGTCIWDPVLGQFVIKSVSTGATSTITVATPTGSGVDVAVTLKLTLATVPPLSPVSPGPTGMNFSNITNLNGAATIITNSLAGGACRFDGSRFHIESLSFGPSSTITYASAAGSGQDVSAPLHLTQATGASIPVNGIAAETALAGVAALRSHPEWYGLQFALTTDLVTADYVAVAGYIEACDPVSIFGWTTMDPATLDPTITIDLSSQMKALGYTRTFGQYSSSSPYASASIFGRAFTVDFEGSNTVITLKFKTEPGVAGEQLTETAALALKAQNCNVFVYYSNDVAIIQEGVMCSGMFFDERHNMDWVANRVQTDLFNILYTSSTKIPQTNAGIHILTTTVEHSLQQGVVNGTIAPGQWNATGFGQISFGQYLPKGYYVWAPLVEDQPQAIREARIAPTIQAAIKLAGAVHKANVIINVNR
jgi:hypothetical protein